MSKRNNKNKRKSSFKKNKCGRKKSDSFTYSYTYRSKNGKRPCQGSSNSNARVCHGMAHKNGCDKTNTTADYRANCRRDGSDNNFGRKCGRTTVSCGSKKDTKDCDSKSTAE